jgi:hypothetical protein
VRRFEDVSEASTTAQEPAGADGRGCTSWSFVGGPAGLRRYWAPQRCRPPAANRRREVVESTDLKPGGPCGPHPEAASTAAGTTRTVSDNA